MAREEGKSVSFVIRRNPDPLRGTIEKMDPNTKMDSFLYLAGRRYGILK